MTYARHLFCRAKHSEGRSASENVSRRTGRTVPITLACTRKREKEGEKVRGTENERKRERARKRERENEKKENERSEEERASSGAPRAVLLPVDAADDSRRR